MYVKTLVFALVGIQLALAQNSFGPQDSNNYYNPQPLYYPENTRKPYLNNAGNPEITFDVNSNIQNVDSTNFIPKNLHNAGAAAATLYTDRGQNGVAANIKFQAQGGVPISNQGSIQYDVHAPALFPSSFNTRPQKSDNFYNQERLTADRNNKRPLPKPEFYNPGQIQASVLYGQSPNYDQNQDNARVQNPNRSGMGVSVSAGLKGFNVGQTNSVASLAQNNRNKVRSEVVNPLNFLTKVRGSVESKGRTYQNQNQYQYASPMNNPNSRFSGSGEELHPFAPEDTNQPKEPLGGYGIHANVKGSIPSNNAGNGQSYDGQNQYQNVHPMNNNQKRPVTLEYPPANSDSSSQVGSNSGFSGSGEELHPFVSKDTNQPKEPLGGYGIHANIEGSISSNNAGDNGPAVQKNPIEYGKKALGSVKNQLNEKFGEIVQSGQKALRDVNNVVESKFYKDENPVNPSKVFSTKANGIGNIQERILSGSLVEHDYQDAGYQPRGDGYEPQNNGYDSQSNGYYPEGSHYEPPRAGFETPYYAYQQQSNGYQPQGNREFNAGVRINARVPNVVSNTVRNVAKFVKDGADNAHTATVVVSENINKGIHSAVDETTKLVTGIEKTVGGILGLHPDNREDNFEVNSNINFGTEQYQGRGYYNPNAQYRY